jgi:hypothetical protein
VEGGELSIEDNQGSIPQRSRASRARRTDSRQDKSDDSFEDETPIEARDAAPLSSLPPSRESLVFLELGRAVDHRRC